MHVCTDVVVRVVRGLHVCMCVQMSLRESYKSYLMESFQHDAHLHTRLASRAGHLTPHSGLASRTSLTGRSSRMHEFLTATELAGSTAQELKSHLGKATRTT